MNKAGLVKQWLEIAKTDLKIAQHLFDTMHPKKDALSAIKEAESINKACIALIPELSTPEQGPELSL